MEGVMNGMGNIIKIFGGVRRLLVIIHFVGIVSMLALVTGDKTENLILAFCEKLCKAPSNSLGSQTLLLLFFFNCTSPKPLN